MMRTLTLTIALVIAPAAAAHDWFTDRRDPVSDGRCCGGTDCAEITDLSVIEETEAGYWVRMSANQARRINKNATAPVNELVPWPRVQPSQSGAFALCISQTSRVLCFFAPNNV